MIFMLLMLKMRSLCEQQTTVIVRSMDDEHKEVPPMAVVEDSNVVASTSSPADVVEVSVSTDCDPVIVSDVVEVRVSTGCDPVIELSGNCTSMMMSSMSSPANVGDASVSINCDPVIVPSGNCMSTTYPDEARTAPEMCGLEDLTRPCAFIAGINEPESELFNKSGDVHSPCGLVAFCQSETSAFTSLVTAKHMNLPVVMQACDEHLHSSCSTRSSHSSASRNASPTVYVSHINATAPQMGYLVSGDEESTPNHSSQSSNYNDISSQPFSGSDEPAQSFTEDLVSKCDVTSSCEQNSLLPSGVDESLSQEQPATCVESAQTVGDCNEGVMVGDPHRIPVPPPGLLPCYPTRMPGMTSAYPQPMFAFVTPVQSGYPPGILPVIHSYPFPAYQMMPPPGMMPPLGIMQMAYPPFLPPGPCYVPPSVMCQPSSAPLQTPVQPLPPR